MLLERESNASQDTRQARRERAPSPPKAKEGKGEVGRNLREGCEHAVERRKEGSARGDPLLAQAKGRNAATPTTAREAGSGHKGLEVAIGNQKG